MMKKRFLIVAAILTLVMVLSACAGAGDDTSNRGEQTGDSAYQQVTAEEAKNRMDQGGVLVVDVRRADEYAAGHIPGAINIPNESIDNTQPPALPDLTATLIVYCRTGVRSEEAAQKLLAIGYNQVIDMGGITDWPYETVTGSEPGTYTPAERPAVLGSFTTTDLDGNPVDQSLLADYNLTMVNVWATFCGNCVRSMPDLGELAQEYQARGVQIVGLVSDVLKADGTIDDDLVATAKELVQKTGADYPQLLPSNDLFGILSQITVVPTTFFVDSEGRQIGSADSGAHSKEKWRDLIEQALVEAGL